MCCKKATTYEGKQKRLDKRLTMVSTIKVSAYVCLKYVPLVRKTIGGFENSSKPIDRYHDQDGHNLVESPRKCFVYGKNKNKLRGLQAQSVHTIER